MATSNTSHDDAQLQDHLKKYVSQNLKRKEIFDFMQNGYPEHPWRLSSLNRRLRYFSIYYFDYTTAIETVCEAVSAEI